MSTFSTASFSSNGLGFKRHLCPECSCMAYVGRDFSLLTAAPQIMEYLHWKTSTCQWIYVKHRKQKLNNLCIPVVVLFVVFGLQITTFLKKGCELPVVWMGVKNFRMCFASILNLVHFAFYLKAIYIKKILQLYCNVFYRYDIFTRLSYISIW